MDVRLTSEYSSWGVKCGVVRGWIPLRLLPSVALTFVFGLVGLFFYLLQPKLFPSLSFSGMYRKPFIYSKNRTNLR